jgi:hypothetical protein
VTAAHPIALAVALAFLTAACGARDLPPPPVRPPEPAPSPITLAQPKHPETGEGTITLIEARAAVPLTGPRVDAKPGDYLLQNADSAAVVSAEGRIIDFGAKGGRDEITGIDPTVFLGLDAAHTELQVAQIVGDGGHILYVIRRVLEKPLLLHVFVTFVGDRLRVETAVTTTAITETPVAITLGERVGWSNVPTWAEGHGFITHAGTFGADFLARDSYGAAYALCAEGGRLHARFGNPESGFHEAAVSGELPEVVRPDKPTSPRVIAITHAVGSLGKAAMALPCGGPRAKQPLAMPDGLPKTARVEIARCPKPGKSPTPYARFFPDESGLALPDGCFQMRLGAAGHASTPWFSPAEAKGHTLVGAARLHFAITDHANAKPLPARVLVRGIKGTPDPDWGDDPDAGAALDVVYTETGEGERPVPAGEYRVTIDRGFEYTAFEKEVSLTAGRTTSVTADLERVVDTKGWIAADCHLHAMPSPDAIQPLADRVRALVATGVEVGVATDHNKVTDYKPIIAELGVGRWVASVVGDEVTTREPNWGHFNVFPLPSGGEPVPYRGLVPRAIFAAARSAGPLGPDTIVQVNHPRMGSIGYFELLRFDPDDPKGWAQRVPVADTSFEALEVFNGDHYAAIPKVEEVMRDWYALLDAGYRVTATGNSDSHKLTFHEPGVPRNLVMVPNDDPAAFDERAFIAAVRKGRVVVSSGPFIRFTANGRNVGDAVPPGEVELVVEVDAPPWVDVDKVELVRRGEVIATWAAPFPKGTHRFEGRLKRALQHGDWVLAVARGTKPMTFLHRPNARPFAFTNPIWVE